MRQELARLSKNTLIYGVGGLVQRFIGFLFLPVFTAYLTPADYGISAILGLVTLVVTSVFSLGLGAGVGPCYFEGNRQDQRERTIWTAFALLVASAAGLVACGLWLAPKISLFAFQVVDHADLVRLTIFAAALNILMIPFTLRLQFEEQAGTFVLLTVGSSLVSIGASLLLVAALGRGVRGLVEAGLIGQVVGLPLFLIPTVRTLRFRLHRGTATELLRLSLPLVPGFAFVFLLLHGNKYILQWMRGLDDVGIYSIGFNFGMVLNLLVSAFQTAWYPYFMSFLDRQEEARDLFGRIFTYYVLGIGGLTLLFFVLARPVVVLMTQPAFHQAYMAVGLSATAQLCLGAFSLLLPGIYFAREIKYVSLVQAIATVASVGLNVVLIRGYGVQGAALGLVLGLFSLVVLQYLWNRHRRYLDVRYEWPRLGAFGVVFIGYALCSLLDAGFSRTGHLVILGLLGGLLPWWMYLLLTPRERAIMRGTLGPFTRGAPSRLSGRA
ncbi:MAG TPA: oligosaccharide flippase family protein [Anaerolineales bacterium]|nr:oligosaccharide flippase family protein [Anaerolineales bacterium]